MIVHDRDHRPSGDGRRPRRRLAAWKVAVGGMVWTGLVFWVSVAVDWRSAIRGWAEDRGYMSVVSGSVASELAGLPGDVIGGWRRSDRVPAIALDIRLADLQRLHAQRRAALAEGILIQGPDDFVRADIRSGGRAVRVQLRLKGDWADQLSRDAWAFRVHVRGDDHLFGMRRFSLHHPRERNYHGEPLFFHALRRQGVLTPRYSFVDVTLNGDFLGRMALEEHFSQELLESQGRRESVILKFDESPLWSGRLFESPATYVGYANTTIETFRPARVAASDVLSADLAVGRGMLRGFVEGRVSASSVFDVELMGRFIGTAEAWGAWHALIWHNLRFYYNPINARLEPIAFDAMIGDPLSAEDLVQRRDPFIESVLADSVISAVYARVLDTIGRGGDAGHSDSLAAVQESSLRMLRRRFPLVRPFPLTGPADRARRLRAIGEVGPTLVAAERSLVQAFLIDVGGQAMLELRNRVPEPVIVTDLRWRPRSEAPPQPVPSGLVPTLRLPLRLDPMPPGSVPESSTFPVADGSAPGQWLVFARRADNGQSRTVAVQPYSASRPTHPIPAAVSLEAVVGRGFRISPDGDWVVVPSGRRVVAETLSLPRGLGLRIEAGTTLRFASGASLIVRGPMDLLGTPDRPVRLEAQPTPGGAGTWPGLVVLEAGLRSRWTHVVVADTRGVTHDGWQLSGGVTFFESAVTMRECDFRGHRGEDALNLVHSEFSLTDVRFDDAASDAIDIDFGTGSVHGGWFADIGVTGGGDAIDISGATVEVTGAQFTNVGDKAISVGEASVVTVGEITVDGAGAGIVAKDRSRVTVTGATLRNVAHGALMAYVKKAEFGPARLDATRVEIVQSGRPTWVQTGSTMTVDGAPVPTEAVNVDSLYETAMRRGTGR